MLYQEKRYFLTVSWSTIYGFPKIIHSDQGANFERLLMKELCNILDMGKSRLTSYNPMGYGMCELLKRTLLDILHTL